MDDTLSGMLNDAIAFAGDILGNALYDISRPNYSSSSTAANIVGSSISMRIDRNGGGAGAEPNFSGAPYYTVGCDRTLIMPGDILLPSSGNSPNISRIPVTIQNFDVDKDIVAFRSGRVGTLTASVAGTPLFTNVAFDYFGIGNSSDPQDPEMTGSLPYEQLKAYMWRRNGIVNGHRLIDSTTGIVWDIDAVLGTGPIMVLLLKVGVR